MGPQLISVSLQAVNVQPQGVNISPSLIVISPYDTSVSAQVSRSAACAYICAPEGKGGYIVKMIVLTGMLRCTKRSVAVRMACAATSALSTDLTMHAVSEATAAEGACARACAQDCKPMQILSSQEHSVWHIHVAPRSRVYLN